MVPAHYIPLSKHFSELNKNYEIHFPCMSYSSEGKDSGERWELDSGLGDSPPPTPGSPGGSERPVILQQTPPTPAFFTKSAKNNHNEQLYSTQTLYNHEVNLINNCYFQPSADNQQQNSASVQIQRFFNDSSREYMLQELPGKIQ